MNFDELMMHRCLALASNGAGKVGSNPMVGAILAVNETVIGEGFHEIFGGRHAEINAIDSVPDYQKHLIGTSTLYVNLEPCNHVGKTPPCSDAIIQAGIKKVVIGTADPNPKVDGGGILKLKSKGVEVIEGVLEQHCRELNKFFFTFTEQLRPYVTLKWAQSADGFVAQADRKPLRFTNHSADMLVHKWRTEYASILVGGQTVITDDPLLTARKWPGSNPIRVVINTGAAFSDSLHIMNSEAQTVIFNFEKNSEQGTLHFIKIEKNNILVLQILDVLYRMNINSVLVEGGPKTIALFVDAGLWDEARIFISKQQLGIGTSSPQMPGSIIQSEMIDGQLLITTKPV